MSVGLCLNILLLCTGFIKVIVLPAQGSHKKSLSYSYLHHTKLQHKHHMGAWQEGTSANGVYTVRNPGRRL